MDLERWIPGGRAALFLTGLAACILDNITTAIALSRPGYIEERAGSRILIEAFGLQGGLAIKAFIIGLICISFLSLSHETGIRRAFGLYGLTVIAAGFLQVVIMNSLLLFVYT